MKKNAKMTILILVFIMTACSTQPKTQPQGQIVFSIFSLPLKTQTLNENIWVEVILEQIETGTIFKKRFKFKSGYRIEFLNNLAPGRYVAKEYAYNVHDYLIDSETIQPHIELMVYSGQTTRFPREVSMSAIYPSGGLNAINDPKYWDKRM